jgi:phage recombination protein Bet
MAGKTISQESLLAATKRYCDSMDGATFTIAEDGDRKGQIRIMHNGAPADSDVFVWLEAGLLTCSNQDFGLGFMEYLTEAPKRPGSAGERAIVPKTVRYANGEALVASGTTLTLEKVRNYFCKTATDEECAFALEVCAVRGLNPFKKDCYFVRYEGKEPKLEIIVSKDYLLKKAMSHPDFKSFRAGVTVQKGEEVSNVERYYAYPGEKLLGGWAEIKRKFIETPFKAEIPMEGFAKESRFWKAMPGLMIRKVAGALVLREAFPEELGGLYDVDELGIDPAKEIKEA